MQLELIYSHKLSAKNKMSNSQCVFKSVSLICLTPGMHRYKVNLCNVFLSLISNVQSFTKIINLPECVVLPDLVVC